MSASSRDAALYNDLSLAKNRMSTCILTTTTPPHDSLGTLRVNCNFNHVIQV